MKVPLYALRAPGMLSPQPLRGSPPEGAGARLGAARRQAPEGGTGGPAEPDPPCPGVGALRKNGREAVFLL